MHAGVRRGVHTCVHAGVHTCMHTWIHPLLHMQVQLSYQTMALLLAWPSLDTPFMTAVYLCWRSNPYPDTDPDTDPKTSGKRTSRRLYSCAAAAPPTQE